MASHWSSVANQMTDMTSFGRLKYAACVVNPPPLATLVADSMRETVTGAPSVVVSGVKSKSPMILIGVAPQAATSAAGSPANSIWMDHPDLSIRVFDIDAFTEG
jgi:hypothetical protein